MGDYEFRKRIEDGNLVYYWSNNYCSARLPRYRSVSTEHSSPFLEISERDMNKDSWVEKIKMSDAAKFKPGVVEKIVEDWEKGRGK